MGRLISWGIMLLLGILVYNYFLGDETEKQQSKEVFQNAKEIGQSIKELIKSEKERYNEGKYEKVLAPLKKLLNDDQELSAKHQNQVETIEGLQGDIEEQQQLKEQNSPRYDEEIESLLKKKLDKELQRLSDDLSN